MTSVVRVGALGTTVEVRLHGAGKGASELADRLEAAWHLCPADPATPVGATVELDVTTGDPLDDLAQVVTVLVTDAAVDAAAGTLLMLHAACLADPRTGAGVAFVAAGGTGKSTVVRGLGPRHRYVTDETVALDGDGVVVPYAKPVSLRRLPGGELKTEVPPGALGLSPPDGAVRLRAICLLDRREDHRGPPTSWSPGTLDAVAALVPHTSHLVALEHPLGRLAELVESTGGLRVLTYREAADLEPVVARLLGGRQ